MLHLERRAKAVERSKTEAKLESSQTRLKAKNMEPLENETWPNRVNQSGKLDSDSRALSLRDATLYWRLVAKLNYSLRCIDHGESRLKLGRCGYGQNQESGAISAWASDRLDVLPLGGWRSDHIMAYTDSDWAANREDRRSMSGGMLVQNGR